MLLPLPQRVEVPAASPWLYGKLSSRAAWNAATSLLAAAYA
jgi:hypothetical protein